MNTEILESTLAVDADGHVAIADDVEIKGGAELGYVTLASPHCPTVHEVPVGATVWLADGKTVALFDEIERVRIARLDASHGVDAIRAIAISVAACLAAFWTPLGVWWFTR